MPGLGRWQVNDGYSTLNLIRSPLAGKETWNLLPTTPSMLATAKKQFERGYYYYQYILSHFTLYSVFSQTDTTSKVTQS